MCQFTSQRIYTVPQREDRIKYPLSPAHKEQNQTDSEDACEPSHKKSIFKCCVYQLKIIIAWVNSDVWY